jgi:hypothetical protein
MPWGKTKSFAAKAKETTVSWYDDSSDEEVEELLTTVKRHSGKKHEKTPANQFAIPSDMVDRMPLHYKCLKKAADRFKITLVPDKDLTIAKAAFIGGNLYMLPKDKFDAQYDKLTPENKLHLTVIMDLFASLIVVPTGSVFEAEAGKLVSDFFTAQYLLYTAGENADVLRTSLKNGDGNLGQVRGHVYYSFLSNPKVGKALFEVILAIMTRMFQTFTKEQADSLLRKRDVYTSLSGMVRNCYRETTRVVMKQKVETVRGKKVTKRTKETEKGHDVPSIRLQDAPLKPSEKVKLTEIAKQFNDIDKVAAETLKRVDPEGTIPFAKAYVAKVVVDQAYSKVSPIRAILRARKNAIRKAALKGRDPDTTKLKPEEWLEAHDAVLKEIKNDISDEVLNQLGWDYVALAEKVSKEKLRK